MFESIPLPDHPCPSHNGVLIACASKYQKHCAQWDEVYVLSGSPDAKNTEAPSHEMHVRHSCNETRLSKNMAFAHFDFESLQQPDLISSCCADFSDKIPCSHDRKSLQQRSPGMRNLLRRSTFCNFNPKARSPHKAFPKSPRRCTLGFRVWRIFQRNQVCRIWW